jgi:hypothetical protein
MGRHFGRCRGRSHRWRYGDGGARREQSTGQEGGHRADPDRTPAGTIWMTTRYRAGGSCRAERDPMDRTSARQTPPAPPPCLAQAAGCRSGDHRPLPLVRASFDSISGGFRAGGCTGRLDRRGSGIRGGRPVLDRQRRRITAIRALFASKTGGKGVLQVIGGVGAFGKSRKLPAIEVSAGEAPAPSVRVVAVSLPAAGEVGGRVPNGGRWFKHQVRIQR